MSILAAIGVILSVGKVITQAFAVADLAIEGMKKIGALIVGAAQKLGLIPQSTDAQEAIADVQKNLNPGMSDSDAVKYAVSMG